MHIGYEASFGTERGAQHIGAARSAVMDAWMRQVGTSNGHTIRRGGCPPPTTEVMLNAIIGGLLAAVLAEVAHDAAVETLPRLTRPSVPLVPAGALVLALARAVLPFSPALGL